MDVLLKSILKRIIPLVTGSTITGIIFVVGHLGFLFSILVNSIIWLLIGTFLYRYYWGINVVEEIIILYILFFAKLKSLHSSKFYKWESKLFRNNLLWCSNIKIIISIGIHFIHFILTILKLVQNVSWFYLWDLEAYF